MNVSQLEHAATFTDPLPAQSTFERMEELFHLRRGAMIVAKNRRMQLDVFDTDPEAQASDRVIQLNNELTQAELRQKEIVDEIIAVARLIVAEADNSEALLAVLRLREQRDDEAREVGR